MKQNSQWLSQVRTWSNSAECTSTPSGSPARLGHLDGQLEPAPARRRARGRRSSTRNRHSMMSRGTWPSMASDLVADRDARRARPAIRARRRRLEGQDTGQGYGAGARNPQLAWAAMAVDKVLLAAPRGFCAGVEMAIKALAWMVRAFEPPVYCYHEIVHNQLVVDRFRDLGVVFVDDIAEVPPGRPIMLSAHGSAPEVVAAARASGGYVVDAVCPLVTKVHHEVKVRAGKGYQIVYVGHEGHEEAVGTMAVAPDAIHRVESVAEVDALPDFGPAGRAARPDHALATATGRRWPTAPPSATPSLWRPGRSDLCFATTNRQSALGEIAERCDAVVVIGSANSSNTRALERLGARDSGATTVVRYRLFNYNYKKRLIIFKKKEIFEVLELPIEFSYFFFN